MIAAVLVAFGGYGNNIGTGEGKSIEKVKELVARQGASQREEIRPYFVQRKDLPCIQSKIQHSSP